MTQVVRKQGPCAHDGSLVLVDGFVLQFFGTNDYLWSNHSRIVGSIHWRGACIYSTLLSQVPWMAGDESGHFALGTKKPKFSDAIVAAAAEFVRVKQANVSFVRTLAQQS